VIQDDCKKDDFDERVANYLKDINRREELEAQKEAGIEDQKLETLPDIVQTLRNE
jgi:hypothetical protein